MSTFTIQETESRQYGLAKREACAPRMMWCKFAGKSIFHVLEMIAILSWKSYLGCQCDGDRCFGCSSGITKRAAQRTGQCTSLMKHYCSTYGLSCVNNECFKPGFNKPNGDPWETAHLQI